MTYLIFFLFLLFPFCTNAEENAESIVNSSIGLSIEEHPDGIVPFIFFNQLLDSHFYYETRLYGKYAFITQNPPLLQESTNQQLNPIGYGLALKLGYLFNTDYNLNLLPYIRFNLYHNMFNVYSDIEGNDLFTNTYSVLTGLKVSFLVNTNFNPYIDYFGGYQQTNINGSGIYSLTPGEEQAKVGQMVTTFELGSNFKINNDFIITPYIQQNINSNSPNSTAQNDIYKISDITTTTYVFAIKLAYSF